MYLFLKTKHDLAFTISSIRQLTYLKRSFGVSLTMFTLNFRVEGVKPRDSRSLEFNLKTRYFAWLNKSMKCAYLIIYHKQNNAKFEFKVSGISLCFLKGEILTHLLTKSSPIALSFNSTMDKSNFGLNVYESPQSQVNRTRDTELAFNLDESTNQISRLKDFLFLNPNRAVLLYPLPLKLSKQFV